MHAGNYKNITAAGAQLISGVHGVLKSIVINKASAQAVAIYDGTDTSTLANNTLIGTLKASAAEGSYLYNVAFSKGLIIVPAASYAGDLTVSYN